MDTSYIRGIWEKSWAGAIHLILGLVLVQTALKFSQNYLFLAFVMSTVVVVYTLAYAGLSK